MKHNIKIMYVLLVMFVLTQLIGLYTVNYYLQEGNDLPYGMEPPEIKQEADFNSFLISIVFAFLIAFVVLFLLTKFKFEIFLKVWFFVVIIIALGISLITFLPKWQHISLIVFILAVPLAYIKIYKRNFIIHNLTELLIYPGIAAVFVPILNILTVIILLILISIYDMWAVWKSGIMQKMAKYQMNHLKVFSGFFVPYLSKNQKAKLKKMKKSELKKKKIKVNVAILGGGDIVFPIIAAGVLMREISLIASLFVLVGATIGLGSLFAFSEKKKFYPAMPFITSGIFLGMILFWLIF